MSLPLPQHRCPSLFPDDEPVVRTSKGRELVLRTWRHTGS